MNAEPNPIATIVIPTYQRPDMLRQCLESMAGAIAQVDAGSVEVIVSDDSRDDHSRRLVEESFPWVRYVEGPRRGPAANRNCGARQARGAWLLLTDDDCLAEAGWIAAYFAAFAANPQQELFEGRTHAGRPRRSNLEEAPINETGGYLWSCNMAIGMALFRQVGGFCESFPHPALEDVDMRLRLENAGRRPLFVADAAICHPFRPRRGIDFMRKHNASYMHLLERHPELRQALTWRGIAADGLRLMRAVVKDALRYGVRGSGWSVYAAATKTWIDARFKVSSGAASTSAS